MNAVKDLKIGDYVQDMAAGGSGRMEDMVDAVLKEFQVPMCGSYRMLREIILYMYRDASLSMRDAECLIGESFGVPQHKVRYAVRSTVASANVQSVPELNNGKLTPKKFITHCVCKLPPLFS